MLHELLYITEAMVNRELAFDVFQDLGSGCKAGGIFNETTSRAAPQGWRRELSNR